MAPSLSAVADRSDERIEFLTTGQCGQRADKRRNTVKDRSHGMRCVALRCVLRYATKGRNMQYDAASHRNASGVNTPIGFHVFY